MTRQPVRAIFRAALVLVAASGSASCGGGGGTVTSPPPPAPPPPPSAPTVTAQQVFTQLPNLGPTVALKQAPGDTTAWYAVQQAGTVSRFANDPNVNATTLFLNISTVVNSGPQEAGLLGMAFHPNWPTTPEVFVSYNTGAAPATRSIVVRTRPI